MTLEERIEQLEQSNYKLSGRGKYSYVYTNGNHCVKLINSQDTAQLNYLTDPNFKFMCGQYHPNYVFSNTSREGFYEFYGRRFDRPPQKYRGVTWKHYIRCIKDYAYKGKYSYLLGEGLATAIDFIVKEAKEKDYIVDIHNLNIMFDGNQLVINDPIAPRKEK